MQFLQLLTNALLTFMLWATGLGLGMQFTIPQIVAPLRQTRLILIAVALNIVLIPLITWGLTRLLPVETGYATGMLLATFAMAAPMTLKFAQIAKGDVPYAVGLVILLQVLNVLAIPLWAALLFPGGVTVNPLQIIGTLVLDVLLPLGIGLFIRARYPEQAAAWSPDLGKLSTLLLIFVLVLSTLTNLQVLLSLFGSFALLVSLLMAVIAFAAGYFLGGRSEAERRTTAIVTCGRAVGPALLIASQSFPTQPQVIAGVLGVGVIVSILPLFAVLEWSKHAPKELSAAMEPYGND